MSTYPAQEGERTISARCAASFPVRNKYKVCSALDPDKGTELELTVYTLTVHDGGVNQGLCAESKMYIDDLRVKGGVILGRGWEVHDFFVSAQRCGCAVAPPGAAFCPGCMLFL